MPHIFSYTILDADGNQRAVPIYCQLSDASTITQLQAISVALSAALDGALDGQIVKGSLTLSMDLDSGVKTSPVAGSNVQETALINFDADTTDYSFSIDFPAFKQAGFTQKVVNLAQAQVADLVSFLTTTANGFHATDKSANQLLTARAGKKTFRKHRA